LRTRTTSSVIDQRLGVGTNIVSGQPGPREEVRVASASGTSDEESLRDEAIELIQCPWLGQPCEQGVITRSNAIVHCKPLAYLWVPNRSSTVVTCVVA
jgi:hypothetical protein